MYRAYRKREGRYAPVGSAIQVGLEVTVVNIQHNCPNVQSSVGWNCVTGGYVCHVKFFWKGGCMELLTFFHRCKGTFRSSVHMIPTYHVLHAHTFEDSHIIVQWLFGVTWGTPYQRLIVYYFYKQCVLVSKQASIHGAPISAYPIIYLPSLICSLSKVCTSLKTLLIIILIVIVILNYSVQQKETQRNQSRLKTYFIKHFFVNFVRSKVGVED